MCRAHARYESSFELVELPWFGRDADGRLVLEDRSVGPIADLHTHLAFTYVFRPRLDLESDRDAPRHYLALGDPIDLDVYANLNFSKPALRAMKQDLASSASRKGGEMRRTHTAANLLADMSAMGIDASVMLPIDFPFISRNAETYLDVAASHRRLVGFGSVHPYRPRPAAALDRQIAAGARGIKVHPAIQLVRPDDRRAMRLYRLCGERALPVLFHCGPVGIEPRLSRYLSQVRHYRRPIERLPETTFILGHSGALQMEEALELARRNENVYLELSSQSLSNVRTILEKGPRDRIVFGSDWPFYHQSLPLAKVLLASEGEPELRRAVLWENAARLLGLGRPGA